MDTEAAIPPAKIEAGPRRGGGRRECRDGRFLCRGCRRWLEPAAFFKLKNPDSRNGLRSECRACDSLRRQRDRLKAKARREGA